MAIVRILTACGWKNYQVTMDYLAPCCDGQNDADQFKGTLVEYNCVQTDPNGCGDNKASAGNISNNAALTTNYPRILSGLRSQESVIPARGSRDLNFTLSAYGAMLPIVFGSDKLPGNVIWASPVKSNFLERDGELVLYKTLNFALAICEGEITGVIRLWVDGRLILDNSAKINAQGIVQPNADGFVMGVTTDITDPDSPLQGLDPTLRQTKITVFNGAETQVPDGIIVAVEGPENTPAYRGVAYVLFENWVTADSRVPAIEVEVAANVTNLWPRLYHDRVGSTFTTTQRMVLHYDPYFSRVMYQASGSGVEGLVIADGNTLVETAQLVFPGTNQWDNFSQTFGGLVVVTEAVGNQGIVRVLNPFTGTVVASLGPGGGITGHSMTTGFGVMQVASMIMSAFDASGLVVDVFVGISTINNSIGLATIGKTGVITMQYVGNSTLPARNHVCRGVIIDDAHAAAQPTFSDGFTSKGMHIFGMGWNDSEKDTLKPWRLSIGGGNAGSLTAPLLSTYPALSLAEFGGTGFAHSVRQPLMDVDGCLVFFVVPEAIAGRSTRIVKWSPFTGAIVWNTPVTALVPSIQSNMGGTWGELNGEKYAWVDGSGSIKQVDLKTGVVTTALGHLSEQQLPTNIDSHQYYDGYENSLLYFSGIAGQRVVKVFLNRISPATALVSTIIENLTGRAGLQPSELEVADLTVLTVEGYTIRDQKDVRSCFQELQQAFTFDVFESNGKIKYNTRGGSPTVYIPHAHIGLGDNGEWLRSIETNDGARNRKINLTYRDIGREYADNVQSIILDKTGPQVIDSQAAIDVSVPIVLKADKAKKLAEILLYAKQVNKTTLEFTLPPRYDHLDPGDVVSVIMPDASTITMRLRKTSIGADKTVAVTASLEDPDIYNDQVALFGNVGRYTPEAFPSVMPRIDVIALPVGGLSDADFSATTTTYRMHLAFLNYRAISQDDMKPFKLTVMSLGEPLQELLLSPPVGFPTWGFVVNPPAARINRFSTDFDSVLRVKLVNKGGATMGPAPLGHDSIVASSQCNLALCGQELIQFANAVDEGNDTWRLTVLTRSKFGTDNAPNPVTGDKFVLLGGPNAVIDGKGTTIVDVPLAGGPRKLVQAFITSNNPYQPTEASFELMRNLQPWQVAGLKIAISGSDFVVSWQRRTRHGGNWPDDGSDAVPLNETAERYTIWLFKDFVNFSPVSASRYLRKVEVTSPTFTYTAAMQAADGFVAPPDDLYVMVTQHGSTGEDFSTGAIRFAWDTSQP